MKRSGTLDMDVTEGSFVWDLSKEQLNIKKHGVIFLLACAAFNDPLRKIYQDKKHSINENRYFCVGRVNYGILTVRFIYRSDTIRIIGAGYWRKGRRLYYEEEKEKAD